jgi:hypothetical protein
MLMPGLALFCAKPHKTLEIQGISGEGFPGSLFCAKPYQTREIGEVVHECSREFISRGPGLLRKPPSWRNAKAAQGKETETIFKLAEDIRYRDRTE